jgi:organic hydroperoxide reductase OsmC/OhrA
MPKAHDFCSHIRWTGNLGQGNATYKGYARRWQVVTPGKPVIECSNDPLLGGDPTLHNPEDMLLNALSACHMLWYLHLAFEAGIVVLDYEDAPLGHGESVASGAGRFVGATLRPVITLAIGTDPLAADAVHGKIHEVCFIAKSVNFPVAYETRYLHG